MYDLRSPGGGLLWLENWKRTYPRCVYEVGGWMDGCWNWDEETTPSRRERVQKRVVDHHVSRRRSSWTTSVVVFLIALFFIHQVVKRPGNDNVYGGPRYQRDQLHKVQVELGGGKACEYKIAMLKLLS